MRRLLLSLLLLLCCIVFSTVRSVRAQAETPTGTPTPTKTPTAYQAGFYPTVTPAVTSVYECPDVLEGIAGIGINTPEWDWLNNCGQCLNSPTQTLTPTPQPTQNVGRYFTEFNYTAYPAGWTVLQGPYKHFHSTSASCELLNGGRRIHCVGGAEEHSSDKVSFPLNTEDAYFMITAGVSPNVNNCMTALHTYGSFGVPGYIEASHLSSSINCTTETIRQIIVTSSFSDIAWNIGRNSTGGNKFFYRVKGAPANDEYKYIIFDFYIDLDWQPPVPTSSPTPAPIIKIFHSRALASGLVPPETMLINSAWGCEQRNDYSVYCSGSGIGSNSGVEAGRVILQELIDIDNPMHSDSRIFYRYFVQGAGNVSSWVNFGGDDVLLNTGAGLHEGYFDVTFPVESFVFFVQDGYSVGEKNARYLGITDLWFGTSLNNLGIPRQSDMCNEIPPGGGGDGFTPGGEDDPIGEVIIPSMFTDCWKFAGVTLDLSLIGMNDLVIVIPKISICTREYKIGSINLLGVKIGFDALILVVAAALWIRYIRQA